MKYKMLAAVIATALISGCGSDSGPQVVDAYEVKAYDPAVANMDFSFTCTGNVSGTSGVTNGYGVATTTNLVVALTPETCDFTFTGRSNSVDMSNGKSMSGVTYNIPKGMAVAGQLVTASPLSTLLYKKLDGAEYSDAAASQLLTDLGLGGLGLTVAEIFLNTEASVGKLTGDNKSKLLATTAVVSDVVKNASSTASVTELTLAAKSIADATLDTYPLYPSSTVDGTGADIFLVIPKTTVDGAVADPTVTPPLPTPEDAVVQDPDTPPTGGTGGTGGSGADEGTGA